jgi:hypothetical protein
MALTFTDEIIYEDGMWKALCVATDERGRRCYGKADILPGSERPPQMLIDAGIYSARVIAEAFYDEFGK